MNTAYGVGELRRQLTALRRYGRVALVPTMGSLHQGHLELVREAQRHCEHVVVSIFVNPMQFGPNEDLDSYPRTLQADQAALESLGVDLVFAPDVATVYPKPLSEQTRVEVPVISDLYCGASRPGHFVGVSTVVNKLFNMVRPDLAVFGKKDYQQLQVIRQMVTDLCMPIDIVGVETVREADGLAMSSRNRYLSPEQRVRAPRLHAELQALAGRLGEGASDLDALTALAAQNLDAAGFETDYVAIADAESLLPVTSTSRRMVVLGAARLGAARLIDNIEIALEGLQRGSR